MTTTLILAPEPTRISTLDAGVSILEWVPHDVTSRTVVLVPGWGAHPRYYGGLIRALLTERARVMSAWSSGQNGAPLDAHYRHLADLFLRARATSEATGVGAVAESLGATYLLSDDVLTSTDRAVLLAPGLFLRWRQIASRPALHDFLTLIREGRVPFTDWRLDSVSNNPELRALVHSSQLAPRYSDRAYVWHALKAAIGAIISPSAPGDTWIIQSKADELVSPFGAKLLARRLGKTRCRLTLVSHSAHGILWDQNQGAALSSDIAKFLVPGSDVH